MMEFANVRPRPARRPRPGTIRAIPCRRMLSLKSSRPWATIFVLLLTISVHGLSHADWGPGAIRKIDNEFKEMPAFGLEISLTKCQQAYPFHRIILRPVRMPDGVHDLKLFTYMHKAFDARKKSIVFVDGGPGGILGKDNLERTAQTYSDYNVIFFHARGAGCSALSSRDMQMDQALTTWNQVEDLEAIRKKWNIDAWHAIYGYSYGTRLARLYAHDYPQKVRQLVLEGLDEDYALTNEQIIDFMIYRMSKTYSESADLRRDISAGTFLKFLERFKHEARALDLSYGFWNILYWKAYLSYLSHPDNNRTRFSKNALIALFANFYSGEGEKFSNSIYYLAFSLGMIRLNKDWIAQYETKMRDTEKYIFATTNPGYEDDALAGGGISFRSFLARIRHDSQGRPQNQCASVPMLLINGSLDMATPMAFVDHYFANRECASGRNMVVEIEGGGHTSDMKCISQFVLETLNDVPNPNTLKTCERKATVKFYGPYGLGPR